MSRRSLSLTLALFLFGMTTAAAVALACGGYGPTMEQLVSDDSQESQATVEEFRSMGPFGMNRLIAFRTRVSQEWDAEKLARLDDAIDQVASQKYASVSGLYWFTDLEQAKKYAAATKKPILSLHLLGKLTDELSCANSRYFRTTLYANQEIASYLRENYILHWQSVRPVPKVTVDFGDGRKLETTVTGNSVHYVLDAQGRPLDALPGLYGPAAFLMQVTRSHALAAEYAAVSEEQKEDFLRNWHSRRAAELTGAWNTDLSKVKGEAVPSLDRLREEVARPQLEAEKAMRLAAPKARVEMPVLRMVLRTVDQLEAETNDDLWQQIAALHADQCKLDDATVALIKRQNGLCSRSPQLYEMVDAFQTSAALDTVKNEYLLHRRVHEWFARGDAFNQVSQLNSRVYDELFHAPHSDAWMGLAPGNVFTALPSGGIVTNATTP